MFYDQHHIRDFILTKICYAGSHFFGNVTYPKEVRSVCLEMMADFTNHQQNPTPRKALSVRSSVTEKYRI